MKEESIHNWLNKEEAKAKIARAHLRSRLPLSEVDELFLLERAQKAEATARVLRKVIKMLDEE